MIGVEGGKALADALKLNEILIKIDLGNFFRLFQLN